HKDDLAGKKVLITAGPTYEKIDPVRFIGNFSTGKMGYALAGEMAARGAEVVLVSGPVSLPTPGGNIRRIDVQSAREMLAACEAEFGDTDIAVMCAAVADYAPEHEADRKIKREHTEVPVITLVKNPDIAATLGARKRQGQWITGFALETDNEEANAREKLNRKNLDMMVLNSMRTPGAGFGTDTNAVTIICSNDPEVKVIPLKSKSEIAADIVDQICRHTVE
ncbi:MAG: phosphopantothenoylcysteine decarboxylase, partial [Duncaniella sp.]|nr:phosphopantothenoylcysteine decarboxylase [Duncaniella sp.]